MHCPYKKGTGKGGVTYHDALTDTYALAAASRGSPTYREHFLEGGVATTAPNPVEFAHGLMPRGHALQARLAARQARYSHGDAWSYANARPIDIPFLTGDEDFREVPGVGFVEAEERE